MTPATRTCVRCKHTRDSEEFIVGMHLSPKGYPRPTYGPSCDSCRMQDDWTEGRLAPNVDHMPPYERAKRELSYEFRLPPKEWMNRSCPIAHLHLLMMFQYGNIRTEDLPARIAEVRALITRYGPM